MLLESMFDNDENDQHDEHSTIKKNNNLSRQNQPNTMFNREFLLIDANEHLTVSKVDFLQILSMLFKIVNMKN